MYSKLSFIWHVQGMRSESYMNLQVAREKAYRKPLTSKNGIFLFYLLRGNFPREHSGVIDERFQIYVSQGDYKFN
jgi:hypothetical protein